jgi:hypothetical protein
MGIKRRRYCEGDVADVSKRIGNTNLYEVRRSVKADKVDFFSFKKWKSQIVLKSRAMDVIKNEKLICLNEGNKLCSWCKPKLRIWKHSGQN